MNPDVFSAAMHPNTSPKCSEPNSQNGHRPMLCGGPRMERQLPSLKWWFSSGTRGYLLSLDRQSQGSSKWRQSFASHLTIQSWRHTIGAVIGITSPFDWTPKHPETIYWGRPCTSAANPCNSNGFQTLSGRKTSAKANTMRASLTLKASVPRWLQDQKSLHF